MNIGNYVKVLNRWNVHDEVGARNMLVGKGVPEKWLGSIIEDLKKLGAIICEEKEPEVEKVVEKKVDYTNNPMYRTFKKGAAWIFKRKSDTVGKIRLMKKFDFISTVCADLKWLDYTDAEAFFRVIDETGMLKKVDSKYYAATFDVDKTYKDECKNGAWDFMDEMAMERGVKAKKVVEEYNKDWKKTWVTWNKEWKSGAIETDDEDEVDEVEVEERRERRDGRDITIRKLNRSTGVEKKIIGLCFDYYELSYGLNRDFFFSDLEKVGKERDLRVMYSKLGEVFAVA